MRKKMPSFTVWGNVCLWPFPPHSLCGPWNKDNEPVGSRQTSGDTDLHLGQISLSQNECNPNKLRGAWPFLRSVLFISFKAANFHSNYMKLSPHIKLQSVCLCIYIHIYIDQIVINPTATTSYVAKFFFWRQGRVITMTVAKWNYYFKRNDNRLLEFIWFENWKIY